MTPAGKLQDHLKRRVQGTGGQYRKVRWEGRRGCPDCFIWWDWPAAAFVEIKADKDKYSALQLREVERMQNAGIPVFTARDMNDVEAIVEVVRNNLK